MVRNVMLWGGGGGSFQAISALRRCTVKRYSGVTTSLFYDYVTGFFIVYPSPRM